MDCALSYVYLARSKRDSAVNCSNTIRRIASGILGLLLVLTISPASAQLQIGDDIKIKAGALFTAGYQGVYGDGAQIQSNHGLDFGLNGNISGSYYNPNFLSFNIVPYVNQSQVNSDFQSITGSQRRERNRKSSFNRQPLPGSITYREDDRW